MENKELVEALANISQKSGCTVLLFQGSGASAPQPKVATSACGDIQESTLEVTQKLSAMTAQNESLNESVARLGNAVKTLEQERDGLLSQLAQQKVNSTESSPKSEELEAKIAELETKLKSRVFEIQVEQAEKVPQPETFEQCPLAFLGLPAYLVEKINIVLGAPPLLIGDLVVAFKNGHLAGKKNKTSLTKHEMETVEAALKTRCLGQSAPTPTSAPVSAPKTDAETVVRPFLEFMIMAKIKEPRIAELRTEVARVRAELDGMAAKIVTTDIDSTVMRDLIPAFVALSQDYAEKNTLLGTETGKYQAIMHWAGVKPLNSSVDQAIAARSGLPADFAKTVADRAAQVVAGAAAASAPAQVPVTAS